MLSDRSTKQFQSHSLKEGSMRKKFRRVGEPMSANAQQTDENRT